MADNGVPSFAKEIDNKLIFTPKDQEFVAYVPEKYFERKIAQVMGEYIDVLGVFNYTIQDLKTGKNNGLHQFRFPSFFTTKPYIVEKQKDIQLIKESFVEDYRIFRYREGDELFSSLDIVKFIGNVERFVNLWYSLGYINNTVRYDEIVDYILDNMAINGESYGLNAQMIGFTVTEICRAHDNPDIPFRLSKSNNVHNYQSMSIKNISKHVSPYTALVSEDFDESIIYGMMNNTPKDTPLEKILVGED